MAERKNSAARIRANNKYAAKAYDRINIAVPKGRKDEIKALADTRGQSINAYINRAIDVQMERDSSGSPATGLQEAPQAPPGAGVVSLPPDVLEAAERAAEAAEEAVLDFITRAVKTQAQRDQVSLKLGVNPDSGEKLGRETTRHDGTC